MSCLPQTIIKLRLRMLRKLLRVHLHTSEMLKMLNYGFVIQFPYEIRHKWVELFWTTTILIVVFCKTEYGDIFMVNFLFSHFHLFGQYHPIYFSLFIIYFALIYSSFLLCMLVIICNCHSLTTNYYGTIFDGVPGSLISGQDWMHMARIDLGLQSNPNDRAMRFKSLA